MPKVVRPACTLTGLANAAQQFTGQNITSDNAMQLVQLLLGASQKTTDTSDEGTLGGPVFRIDRQRTARRYCRSGYRRSFECRYGLFPIQAVRQQQCGSSGAGCCLDLTDGVNRPTGRNPASWLPKPCCRSSARWAQSNKIINIQQNEKLAQIHSGASFFLIIAKVKTLIEFHKRIAQIGNSGYK